MKSKLKYSTLFVSLAIGILNTFASIAITHASESNKPAAKIKSQFIGVYHYRLMERFPKTYINCFCIPLLKK